MRVFKNDGLEEPKNVWSVAELTWSFLESLAENALETALPKFYSIGLFVTSSHIFITVLLRPH